ncbi:MAG: twin-arginine translocase TatA/TatE family subunit [Coriobacteriia bacterium]|nr:twin-arginine translocase TatA/TatE family subunit [Coriobacteriia bacterium]MCL2136670.1 twin-arginine translocase TatA/TatE family subunit [Coriobacteriia bacterium]
MDFPVIAAAKIFGLGMPELLVILGVALLIFGPKNLPKLGETLGKTVKGVRDGMEGKELDEADIVEEGIVEEDIVEDDDDDEYEEVVVRRKKKPSVK